MIYLYFIVQCKSKSKNITVISTPTECSQTPETDKLMKLILNNFSTSGN